MKLYDVSFIMIVEAEGEDKAEARDNAVVELEETLNLDDYITDTVITEVTEKKKKK